MGRRSWGGSRVSLRWSFRLSPSKNRRVSSCHLPWWRESLRWGLLPTNDLWIPRLFDSFGWVPDALELANIDDLARVVGVVGTNARYRGRPQLKLLVVSGLDSFLPFGEDFVELLDDVGPLGGVEVVEGLVVV